MMLRVAAGGEAALLPSRCCLVQPPVWKENIHTFNVLVPQTEER